MGFFHRRPATDFLPADWQGFLALRLAHWSYLDETERERLGELTGELLSRKRWEAANGFALTDEIRLLIAAQAALLVLGLSFEYYHEVGAIIVHPRTVVLRGPRSSAVAGLMTDAPMPILGEAAHKGPVVIAWDAVRHDARHPERGHNVVFHEFAHKLDMADDVVDGTPPMSREEIHRWVEVCTREYELISEPVAAGDHEDGHGHPHHDGRDADGAQLLSDYAGVNPGEFFAVATEVFFERPVEMATRKPDLYEVLEGFYRQDPAERVRRSQAR